MQRSIGHRNCAHKFAVVTDPHGHQLAAVLDRCGIIISRLEKGYEQLLGRRFEWGTELSGGEWQKIAPTLPCSPPSWLKVCGFALGGSRP